MAVTPGNWGQTRAHEVFELAMLEPGLFGKHLFIADQQLRQYLANRFPFLCARHCFWMERVVFNTHACAHGWHFFLPGKRVSLPFFFVSLFCEATSTHPSTKVLTRLVSGDPAAANKAGLFGSTGCWGVLPVPRLYHHTWLVVPICFHL